MAKSRATFASVICCSDSFTELSRDAQLLYFYLNFEADIDGAIAGHKRLIRSYGFSLENFNELVDNGLILVVEGVPFITDWWVNNKRDQYKYGRSAHPYEHLVSLLEIGNDNRYRVLETQLGPNVVPMGSRNVKEGNVREGNVSKSNLDKCNASCPSCHEPLTTAPHALGGYQTECVNRSCSQYGKPFFIDSNGEIH